VQWRQYPPEALYKQPQHFPDHHNNKPTKIFLTKVCFQSVFCFPNPTLVTTTLPPLSFETSFFLFPNQTSKRYSLIITEIMAPNITTVKTTITDAQAKVATDHGRAYVTFLAGNGDYVKGVVGLAKGLRKVKSMYPLVVAVLPDVPQDHRNILTSQGCIVREFSPCTPQRIKPSLPWHITSSTIPSYVFGRYVYIYIYIFFYPRMLICFVSFIINGNG